MVQFKSFLCNRNLFCFDLLCFVTGSPYVGQSGLQLEIPLTSVFLGLQACATMLGLQWEFLRPLMYIINMEGQEQSTQHGLHQFDHGVLNSEESLMRNSLWETLNQGIHKPHQQIFTHHSSEPRTWGCSLTNSSLSQAVRDTSLALNIPQCKISQEQTESQFFVGRKGFFQVNTAILSQSLSLS